MNFVLLLSLLDRSGTPQEADVPRADIYSLKVITNEVVLTFHVTDAHGHAVDNLRSDEVGLYDNLKRPKQILAFEALHNLPLRAGLLIDKSESMQRSASNTIAKRYAQRLLQQHSDEAFLMEFASQSQTVQPWTDSAAKLVAALNGFVNVAGHTRGTAILDSIYRACINEFGHVDYRGSGNFILLFSDGEDNLSRASVSNVITACQRTNTAIYVFRPNADVSSSGLSTLIALADQSGGQVFHAEVPDDEIDADLKTIEDGLRTQYRLIYRPAELRPDGTFHNVVLIPPDRAATVTARTGYYAPTR